ncbi:MAG TPA: hypothetical protein VK737_11180 [Opitutales bacterium]|jgi:hypothetical protein|nr:hypothetical protein [Opitutales bacterium]
MLLAFAAGWAVQAYWLAQPAKSTPAVRHVATGTNANSGKGSPFSVNYANAVQGNDTAPKTDMWDPATGLAKIVATKTGGQFELALAGLVAQTPPGQLASLINSANLCNDDNAKRELESLAYTKWADADPAAALAFAQAAGNKTFNRDTGPINDVLATWAGHDPQAALAAAESLKIASIRDNGIEQVLGAMAESGNPEDALTAAKSLNLGAKLNGTLQTIYSQWAEHDPEAAFAALDQIPNLGTRNQTASQILETMSASDPAGALRLMLTLPPGAQSGPVNSIFANLTDQNPSTAVQALSQLPAGGMRANAIQGIVSEWAETDPSGAVSWAASLSNPSDRVRALSTAVSESAATDPVGAANDLKLIPDFNQRNQTMSTVLGQWAESDSAAALKWVQTNTVGTTQTMALSQIVQNTAGTDPQGALAIVQQLSDAPNRNNLLFQTIGQWSQDDPAAALQWAKTNLSGTDQTTASTIALNGLAQSNPAAAADTVATMGSSPQRDQLVQQVAQGMATTDIDGALAWLNSVPNLSDASKSNAIASAFGDLAQLDPAAAAQKFQTLSLDANISTSLLNNFSQQFANQWALGDPAAAIAWSENLTGPARQAALSGALNTLAQADPISAWNTAASLPANDPDRAALLNNVISNWARNDPAGVVSANVLGNLNPAQQNNAIRQIASAYINQDPSGASTWINTLPASQSRDQAVQNLLAAAPGSYDTPTGMAWAASITSPTMQTQAYTTVIQQVARTDPGAAQAAINAAGNLTDAQRQQLTQIVLTSQNNNNNNIQVKSGGMNNQGPPPQGFHYEYQNGGQVLVPNN